MNHLIWDLETGGMPWERIGSLYVPPPSLPPWDDGMVKYGNLKDAGKRQEKYTETKAAYEAKLAGEAADLADHKATWIGEAALSPVTGEILMIGVRRGEKVFLIGSDGETEPEMIEIFWNAYKRCNAAGGKLIGYCSNFFDLPFIIWRSYFHKIEVPASVFDKTGRYFSFAFVDLIDRLPKKGFSEESRKLGDVCRWLGIGDKPNGVDGSMFSTLWKSGVEESRRTALDYLANDLQMTYELAERMGALQQ